MKVSCCAKMPCFYKLPKFLFAQVSDFTTVHILDGQERKTCTVFKKVADFFASDTYKSHLFNVLQRYMFALKYAELQISGDKVQEIEISKCFCEQTSPA